MFVNSDETWIDAMTVVQVVDQTVFVVAGRCSPKDEGWLSDAVEAVPSGLEGCCFVASLLVATLGDERTLDDVLPEAELGMLNV